MFYASLIVQVYVYLLVICMLVCGTKLEIRKSVNKYTHEGTNMYVEFERTNCRSNYFYNIIFLKNIWKQLSIIMYNCI